MSMDPTFNVSRAFSAPELSTLGRHWLGELGVVGSLCGLTDFMNLLRRFMLASILVPLPLLPTYLY